MAKRKRAVTDADLAAAIDALPAAEKADDVAGKTALKRASGSGAWTDPTVYREDDAAAVDSTRAALKAARERLRSLWPPRQIVRYKGLLWYYRDGQLDEFKGVVDIDPPAD